MFEKFIERVLSHEGGYVWNDKDPGGETQWGIAKRSHPELDIKALTREQAIEIYRKDYWEGPGIDKLPPAVAFQVFDAAVNHGGKRAIEWLQSAVGALVDGSIGPKTIGAVLARPPLLVVGEFNARRLSFYASLQTWEYFGRGWANRVATNLRYATADA